ncbi:hypothetical protein PV326_001896, partial [Microctonus aethiopoides]
CRNKNTALSFVPIRHIIDRMTDHVINKQESAETPLPDDGLSAAQLFGSGEGLTYNHFIILQGHIDFIAEIGIPLLNQIWPLLWHSLGALELLITIVHLNIKHVKKYKHGFIRDPVVLSPNNTVKDVLNVKAKHGFCGIPITENGKLLGIVTSRDIDFLQNSEKQQSLNLETVMTKLVNLVTAKSGVTLSEENSILETSKKGKLPIINDKGELVSLMA